MKGKTSSSTTAATQNNGTDWIAAFRIYLVAISLGNLLWEFAQLPLYIIWQTATTGALVSAVLHCTAGDMVIALTSFVSALMVGGNVAWPDRHFRRVAALSIVLGLSYTTFSEWQNVTLLHTWTYAARMPIIPYLGIGLSPILQWLVIPFTAILLMRRRTRR